MVKKEEKFKKHQEELFKKLLSILELKEEEDEYEINISELYDDEDKKLKIIELKDDIRLFFNVANVPCFRKDREPTDKEYSLVLMKVFQLMGFSKTVIDIKEQFKRHLLVKFKKN